MPQSATVNVPELPGGIPIDNALVAGAYRQRVESYPGVPVMFDAGGRTRVSQLTTLFDGKTLNADEPNLWDVKGTGTPTFTVSATSMAVTAGQYLVRQAKQFSPYFSGKSQFVELTTDDFANVVGLVKRFGYFTATGVAPYDSDHDGFWVEATGTSYKLCCAKNGVKTLDLDLTLWDGYADLVDYDWANFTVAFFDFLWLGGAVLRLFIKHPDGGFTLAHTFDYAGTAPGVFMRSPNKPVRYEIRSTTGVGSMSAICSQVSTEGSVSEQVQTLTVVNLASVPCNVVGTIYALKGVRAVATYRDQVGSVVKFGGSIVSNTLDGGTLLLLLNPTLSAPLAWATNGRIDEGTGDGTQTVTVQGQIIEALPLVNSADSALLVSNILTRLSVGIDNTMGEIVLGYVPYTATQSVAGMITTARF